MVVLCASCVASRANGALGATWLRAYVDDSGRTSGPRVRRIETAAIGGEGWSDAWDLESGSAEHVRHAYTGAEMNRMFARVPAAAPVVYTTPQRSWIDVGVSNEFDRKVLVEASDDDGESDGVDEKERHDGDEALREKKNKYFMSSVSASSLQHMLNKYGGTVDSAFETINRRLEIDPNNPVIMDFYITKEDEIVALRALQHHPYHVKLEDFFWANIHSDSIIIVLERLSGDLVYLVEKNGGIVATMDKELKSKIKEVGGSVLSIHNDKIILEN